MARVRHQWRVLLYHLSTHLCHVCIAWRVSGISGVCCYTISLHIYVMYVLHGACQASVACAAIPSLYTSMSCMYCMARARHQWRVLLYHLSTHLCHVCIAWRVPGISGVCCYTISLHIYVMYVLHGACQASVACAAIPSLYTSMSCMY